MNLLRRATPDAGAWAGVRNVLCIRLDNLGDVVMTGPALAAVKSHHADMRITLMASSSGSAVAPYLPMIDEVLRYDAPWSKRGDGTDPTSDAKGRRDDLAMIDTIARRGFDAAIVFSVCSQSALPAASMLHYAGVPLRAAHVRENPYALLTHWIADDEVVGDGMRHEVERQLSLVRALGYTTDDDRLVFARTPEHRRSMFGVLRDAGLPDRQRFFVVHPGASAESRRYRADGFGEAARAIQRATGLVPVFVGAASEDAVVEAARAPDGLGVSLVGRLGLGELAALIAEAELMVCNNSGPAHIAAAMATPTVVLYALTNPQHTPWRVRSRVLNVDVPCRNCRKSICPMGHHACLELVSPQLVVDAALDLLAGEEAMPGPLQRDGARA